MIARAHLLKAHKTGNPAPIEKGGAIGAFEGKDDDESGGSKR